MYRSNTKPIYESEVGAMQTSLDNGTKIDLLMLSQAAIMPLCVVEHRKAKEAFVFE